MGSITPIGVTRMGDAVMDYELDTLDEARLRADDLDAEARHAVSYHEWLEQMAMLSSDEQGVVMNAFTRGDKLALWALEMTVSCAFERAVQTKIKEL